MKRENNIPDDDNFGSPFRGMEGGSGVSRYTAKEEIANTYTHAAGIVFGIVAGFLLIQKAILSGNNWAIASDAAFIIFMITAYTSSTFYHAERNEQGKLLRRKFDHAAIYALIAGSYTPFTLVVLRQNGAWGWSLFGVIWLAAILGISLSFMNLRKGSKLETICYVAMGWVVVIAFKPLVDSLSAAKSMEVFWFLIGGGLFYTVGAILYMFKKIPYMHAIWHLFVLGGSVCHTLAIWKIKI
ncbi:MAG TPA: hemolysin III family protein [Paludibacter sp.]|nr:hemolysin III family protein [Paludibacter sp.]